MNDAKELRLSPSAILEEALRKAVKVAKYERWQQENKQAIAEHNRRIEEQGTFSEKIRQL
jgi:antitoxin CcdA